MKIDCRNLSCPQPIVETKNALEKLHENEILEIILNSYISKNNVVKFLNSLNLNPIVDQNAQEFCIKVKKKNFN
ncbi:TPA: sulfurtransferase TusA family protein, partial [Campylobacter jejuni]|nr:sulfurtransferase TusA family protein [Campylobacter jejuni]